MRWTTGIGIVLGGTGGALAALMGSPKAPALAEPAPAAERAKEPSKRAAEVDIAPAAVVAPVAAASVAEPAPSTSVAPVAAAIASASAAPPASTVAASPPLDVPATVEALHRAMLFCDQKKAFDECTRASLALDLGTTGPADPEQAKRFRKIALTHLVGQCESGSSHACFVLAAKYRAGTEMPANPGGADVLEKRALNLCRHNTAPECPTP